MQPGSGAGRLLQITHYYVSNNAFSVCEFVYSRRNQTNHQNERDHKVRKLEEVLFRATTADYITEKMIPNGRRKIKMAGKN
jgi:hypothetical protein